MTSKIMAVDLESFRRVKKLANLVGEVNARIRAVFEETGNPKKRRKGSG